MPYKNIPFDTIASVLTKLEDGPADENTLPKSFNVDRHSAKKHVDMLLRLGLIANDTTNHCFSLTDIGREYLHEYRKPVRGQRSLISKKILVVDDEEDNLIVFRTILQKAGYQVDAVTNPSESLQHFKKHPATYDLVISAIRLSHMTGFELVRQIRKINPATKVLLTSTFEINANEFTTVFPSTRIDGMVIKKPARPTEVVSVVKEALSNIDRLVNPDNLEHIAVLYDEDASLYDAVARYINEGLKKDQLCVYTYIGRDSSITTKDLALKIIDFEENIRKGNLLAVDFTPICVSPINSDLSLLDDLKKQLTEKVKAKENKHIRFVGRAAGWLFENRYFDQCILVETWWQSKPFEGSFLCPFRKSLFEERPFFDHKDSVFGTHATVIIYDEQDFLG